MSDDPNAADTSIESRVAAAADEYLEARERGEAPDVEAFLGQHPTLAPVLRDVLPALDAIGAIGTDDPSEDRDEHPRHRPIGDFLIQREIGRGGMGVVYEAEQLSLGRRVALKVLPFAAVLDPRQLERFKNEAQAAARLHHGNIVPVYSVGQDRGVHYYAMQYIEGLTVAQIINELREREGRDERRKTAVRTDASSTAVDALTNGQSTASSRYCRAVARLGVQAARALDHAHELGVVHRDIKPANLIVDLGGNLWITDFGLASFYGTETRSLTMSGDLLGTLRYMSPEQALAKRVPIDYRTDTYSLGVTLYEFLTLEPAVASKNSSEILQEIAFKEARPARDLNAAIPEDLETILIKAMAKDPSERYATVLDMAEDLQRYLDGMPIEAKRPSLLKRATKWCGRHKGVVAAAGLIGVALFASQVVATFQVRAAYRQELAERARAERNFARARDAVDSMLTEVATRELAEVPGAAEVRRRLLEKAQAFYQDFLAEAGDAPEVQLDAARAHARVGDISDWLGDHAAAEASYEEALRLVLPLVERDPEDPEYAHAALTVHRSLGNVQAGLRRVPNAATVSPSAESSFAAAIAIGNRLVDAFPDVRAYWEGLGHAYNDLGRFRVQVGRFADAEEPLLDAASVYRRLMGESPDVPHYAYWFTGTQQNLGIVFRATKRRTEGEEVYDRAIRVCSDLVFRFPDRPAYRLGLTRAYANLGVHIAPQPFLPVGLYSTHRGESGEPLRVILEEGDAWADIPDAEAILALPRAERAAAASRTARSLARSLIDKFPQVKGHRGEFVKSSINLAVCQYYGGDVDGAMATLRENLNVAPEHAWGYMNLAFVLCETVDPRQRDVVAAIPLAEEAVRLDDEWQTSFVLGVVRYRNGDWPGAIEAYENARSGAFYCPELIGILLSMAHWQNGDEDAAKKEFAWGTSAMDLESRVGRAVHVRYWPYRREAAQMLGVRDTREPVPSELSDTR